MVPALPTVVGVCGTKKRSADQQGVFAPINQRGPCVATPHSSECIGPSTLCRLSLRPDIDTSSCDGRIVTITCSLFFLVPYLRSYFTFPCLAFVSRNRQELIHQPWSVMTLEHCECTPYTYVAHRHFPFTALSLPRSIFSFPIRSMYLSLLPHPAMND